MKTKLLLILIIGIVIIAGMIVAVYRPSTAQEGLNAVSVENDTTFVLHMPDSILLQEVNIFQFDCDYGVIKLKTDIDLSQIRTWTALDSISFTTLEHKKENLIIIGDTVGIVFSLIEHYMEILEY